ncbi:MAG: hypothetical protein RL150_118 [Candidatus Parcubacteria bacterium]|jgi:NTP pyrophosphatase (non-canonical NTP hydrolase)
MKPFLEHTSSINGLYGPRNSLYLSQDEMYPFIMNAVRQLSKLVRKRLQHTPAFEAALVSVFGRTCSFAHTFRELPLLDGMIAKYPSHGCGYCGNQICGCENHVRDEHVETNLPDSFQRAWSVHDWCRHLDQVYGNVNNARGLEGTLLRLHEEMGEVSEAVFLGRRDITQTREGAMLELAKEIADLFAWLFAIANLCDINLEELLEHHYGGNCRHCGKRPCDCGPFITNRAGGSQLWVHTRTTDE